MKFGDMCLELQQLTIFIYIPYHLPLETQVNLKEILAVI